MPSYWLVKSEPSVYSWEQLVKDKKTVWNGVRNYAARNNIRAMNVGDEVLYYHSNEGMEIVGIAKVIKKAYQDPTTTEPAWLAVDIKPVRKLKTPVSLETLKKEKSLVNMDLIRLGRLSVQTVKPEEWELIMQIAGEK